MKWIGKVLLLGLILSVILVVPVFAAEQEMVTVEFPVTVNPEYAHILDPNAVELPFYEAAALYAQPEYLDKASAAALVTEYLKIRSDVFDIYVRMESPDQDKTELFYELVDLAMTHTGDPVGGDYIRKHFASYGGNMSYYPGSSDIKFTFRFTYYTSAEQEEELTEAVETLLDELDLYQASDYDKVKGVYDYMTHNISYDYDGLADGSDNLEYSAYDALINKSAVCQGYANLLYRLLLELGVDNRIVAGNAYNGVKTDRHAWNIVGLNNLYYSVDATWDATYASHDYPYAYFLLGENEFSADHFPDAEYTTTAFKTAYSLSQGSYVLESEPDPFDILGARLTLENEINMDFAFPVAAQDDWTGAYAQIEKDYCGYETVTQNVVFKDWRQESVNGADCYVVSFAGVAAKEMNDQIRVTIYNRDDEPISNVWTDSIKGYVMRNFSKVSTKEAKLYADMLNYGAAAQIFFKYDTDNLVTSAMTEAQKDLATTTVETENNLYRGENYKFSRLVLVSRIELQLAFENIDRTMCAEYSFTDHYGNLVKGTISGTDFEIQDNLTIVTINQQVLADARQEVTVKVYNASGKEVAGAVDSVESYVHRNANNLNLTAQERDLHQKIIRFANSAHNFFH